MFQYQELVAIATAAAEAAATFIRKSERPHRTDWTLKGRADFVTEVDRGAESCITRDLRAACPESVVRGEELAPDATDASLTWIVDPLDGTTNYLHGYPWYAVSIAAVLDGRLAAGVVVDIPHGITYHAAAGHGAFADDVPLEVSATVEPAGALIGTGYPFKAPHLMERYLEQFPRVLRATAGVRRAGSAALDLVDVAGGRFDGFWELQLAPWDVAAATLIAREAGGRVTDLEGSDDVVRHGPIVAGNPAIHAWLLDQLRLPDVPAS